MKHYSELELERYLNGEMSWLFRFICSRHLKVCPSCRIIQDDVMEDRRLAKEIRESVKTLEEVKQNIEKSKMSWKNDQG